ncbi:hypothetical protein VP01_130g13 [Puccinia sorghi]|uniref:Uncharacterized protein n=1 Tax=Puccinia sorghi TaxID=27349 RepID=A0A0L6VPP7_9BASI|nr:hypothetical protein VP01_130g13 [Puccinia sorghi]
MREEIQQEPSKGALSSGEESETHPKSLHIKEYRTQGHMSRWGLSDGVIAKLKDNVQKYEKKLKKSKI